MLSILKLSSSMVLEELQSLWESISADLANARSLLPLELVEIDGNIEQYEEWLKHNELELAFDELVALGENNFCVTEFWLILSAAAHKMGLVKKEALINLRFSQGNE